MQQSVFEIEKDNFSSFTSYTLILFSTNVFTMLGTCSLSAIIVNSSFPFISVGVDTKSDFKVIYENNIRIVGGKLFGEPREIIIPPNLSKINNLIKK